MADRFMDEDVKTRLILSGVTELEEYGIRDFSLRRAALIAGVSCAAPYRYFKSKEEYIAKIFEYLADKWNLLFDEICAAYSEDEKKKLVELSCAGVRFWLANKNLRTALLLSDSSLGGVKISDFDQRLSNTLMNYFFSHGTGLSDAEGRVRAIRAQLWGYVTLLGAGEIAVDESSFAEIKNEIKDKLEL